MQINRSIWLATSNIKKNYTELPLIVRLFILSLIYAATSQIIIPMPFNLVPLSVQPAPVFIAAIFLGWEAVGAYSLYLIEGACGAPFFSGFQGGLVRLLGPTGGYLIGFFLGMIVLAMVRNFLTQGFLAKIWALMTAWIITFVLGLTQLAMFVSNENLLNVGLYPFIIGDLVIKFFVTLCVWNWLEK